MDIAVPQPLAVGCPALTTRKITTGTIIPPRPAASGTAIRRRSRSSPMSNSRRASSPITRKKNVIRPSFSQPCRSWDTPKPPTCSPIGVRQSDSYEAASTFTQMSAVIVAASRTAALPVSVRRNCRSGVCRCRPHAVRPAAAASGPGRVSAARPSPRAGSPEPGAGSESGAMTAVNHAGDLGHRHGRCLEVSCKFTITAIARRTARNVCRN